MYKSLNCRSLKSRSLSYAGNKTGKGFTLIEVLIVVAILGILAAIVIPAYSEQVRKTRRSDAKITLMQNAQTLERCLSDNNSYDPTVGDGCTDFTVSGGVQSAEGFYTITATTQTTSAYILQADPIGAQADDTHCDTFTLDQTGLQSATNSDGVAQTDCW